MSDTQPPAGPDRWASVVYGRTLTADIWWRALPEPFDRQGSEADAVLAAVSDGRALSRSPRFVLARRHAGTLVGVACQAIDLSPDMNSDGRRPLFCLVGWFCADAHAGVPPLTIVEDHWRQWAAEEYERWMRPAWNAHASRLRAPSPTSPEAPPWRTPGRMRSEVPDMLPERGYSILAEAPGQVRVHPSAERAWVWQAVARYGLDTTLVTGWESRRDARLDGVTDVCADDVRGNQPLLVPAPGPAGGTDQPTRGAPAPLAASTAGPSPDRGRHEAETSSPGHGQRDPRNLGVRKIRERADRFLRGDADRDFPPPPEPPPPPAHGRWRYEQRHHAFYSQAGGFLSCWNGYQLFRWDRDHWVAQTPPPEAEDEPSSRGESAAASRPVPAAPASNAQRPSAANIEQLSAGFGEFDKASPREERPGPAGDQ